jgi:peptide/nickel transport system substrate-binding protein
MKLHVVRNLFALILIFSMGLTACSGISLQSINSVAYSSLKVAAKDCSYGGEIRSVEALDGYSVKFTLCSPDAAFPNKMASPIFAVQDKDFLDSHKGDSTLLSAQPNGTGPFYWAPVYSITLPIQLKVSPTYWGSPPRLTDIYFHWYKNSDLSSPSRVLADADVFNSVKTSALATILTSNPIFPAYSHQALNVVYLGFNNTVKPMDDVTLRKAIAMVLDRSYLVQNYLPTGSEVAQQLIPSSVSPGRTDTLHWYDVRPKDATDSLSAIKFNFDQELTLAFVNTASSFITSPEGMALEIQKELAAVNLKVTLKPMTQTNFDNAMAAGSEMMFIGNFEALYDDGAAFYELPLVRQEARFGNPYASLQKELKDVLAESTITARQAKFDILNQDFKDLVPMVPIGHASQLSYFRNTYTSISTNANFENYVDLYNDKLTLQVYEATRPVSLWPADENDNDTFRITRLMYDTLVVDGYGSSGLQPSLADSWKANGDLTEWTFYLRYNVKFTNGATLDANDVVASFAAIWDASSPNHKGRTGDFTIFKELFGSLVNQTK